VDRAGGGEQDWNEPAGENYWLVEFENIEIGSRKNC